MKKIAFCLVLLSLSTITFAGCAKTDKPAEKPTTGAADKTGEDTTTPAADENKDTAPAAPSTEPPADETKK